MASLNTHLRRSDLHGTLPFHPDCPICRETRLAGTLGSGELVPVRAQALLAAGLLACSSAAPATAALAAEPDREAEGTQGVSESPAADPAGDPGFDPGGEPARLPDAAPPEQTAPAEPGSSEAEAGPPESAEAAAPAEPVVDPGDGADETGGPPPSTIAAEPSSPPAQAAPQPPAPVAVAPAPPEPAPVPAPAPPAPEVPPPAARAERSSEREKRPRARASERPSRVVIAPRVQAAGPVAPAPAVPVATASGSAADTEMNTVRPGDRTHTVQSGESLWAIAADLLGPDATPAQIAREVNRLWQRNRDRIATGDPDLLMPGTKLELR